MSIILTKLTTKIRTLQHVKLDKRWCCQQQEIFRKQIKMLNNQVKHRQEQLDNQKEMFCRQLDNQKEMFCRQLDNQQQIFRKQVEIQEKVNRDFEVRIGQLEMGEVANVFKEKFYSHIFCNRQVE
jgi:hypothetical protein